VSDLDLKWFRDIHEIHAATAAETAAQLGPDTVTVFVQLSNDAIDMTGALSITYSREELLQSLVSFDFVAIHQLLAGMSYDFFSGRYEAVRRDLRFVWESICRSFLVDCFRELKPAHPNPPGSTLDEKVEWLANPQLRLDWNTAILPVLQHIFPPRTEEAVKAEFKPVWDRLNAAAHPSAEWRVSGVEESMRHVWHHFDEAQARALIADTRVVFAVVFAAILTRFPKAAEKLAADPDIFRECRRFAYFSQVLHRKHYDPTEVNRRVQDEVDYC
jgi:hypothetical protein